MRETRRAQQRRVDYSTENGKDAYRLEYEKDEDGNWVLLRKGEDVTIDSLAL